MPEILLSAFPEETLASALERLRSQNRLRPFGDLQMNFVRQFAASVLSDSAARAYPDILAFAFWMRGARLKELREGFAASIGANVAPRSRGLALHFAPSNVDTVFAYSWFLSLLAGNANVVRLSRRRNVAADFLLAHLDKALHIPEFAPLLARSLVVTYDHDDALTAELSAASDLRVIWGGDATVSRIRKAPLRPDAEEVVFPDRFSLAVFRAANVAEMDGERFRLFIRDFRNDTLTFGQMGCSSPRAIVWVGSAAEIIAAKSRLAAGLGALLAGSDDSDWSQPVSARLTSACLLAIAPEVSEVVLGSNPALTRVTASTLSESMREIHEGGGCFVEISRGSLEEIENLLRAKDQTLVAHGFSADELVGFMSDCRQAGVDRVVPVGAALDFAPVWDGQDLLRRFTRITTIRVA